MKKIETIWHHILTESLNRAAFRYTQQEVAQRFHYSLSTVHHALRTPTEMGAIRKAGKFFVLQDFKKLLYYWASFRALSRDLLYETAVNLPIREIEGLAIPGSVYGAYTAAKRLLGEAPADYSKACFYILQSDLTNFKRRFPPKQEIPCQYLCIQNVTADAPVRSCDNSCSHLCRSLEFDRLVRTGFYSSPGGKNRWPFITTSSLNEAGKSYKRCERN